MGMELSLEQMLLLTFLPMILYVLVQVIGEKQCENAQTYLDYESTKIFTNFFSIVLSLLLTALLAYYFTSKGDSFLSTFFTVFIARTVVGFLTAPFR